MRVKITGSAFAALLLLAGCGDSSTPAQNNPPAETPARPVDKIDSMRPADQAAFLEAFESHDQALKAAPNAVAKADIRKVEDPKLCKVIDAFKEFHDWTAEVRSISVPDANPNEIQITVTLNGSLGGYLATDHIDANSPLYPKIKTLKDGFLHGSTVLISGAVTQPTKGISAIEYATDTTGTVQECVGRSDFDVKLSKIDEL